MDILKTRQITDKQQVVLQTLAEFAGKPGSNFLEIGSWLGDSTIILGQVAKKHNGHLFCVDWWKGNPGTDLKLLAEKNDIFTLFWDRVCRAGLEEVVVPVRASSDVAISALKAETFNLVFIDGDHRYDQALRDIQNYRSLVNPQGGILCGHDCEGYLKDFDKTFLQEGKDLDYHQTVHCGVVLAVGAEFKKYSIDYSVWSVTRNGKKNSWESTQLEFPTLEPRKQATPPPFATSKNYKLYRTGRQIFAAPHALEDFDPTENPTPPNPKILMGKDIFEIKEKINEEVLEGPSPSLIESYKNYNLVRYQNKVFAVHQLLGPMDLTQVEEQTIKENKEKGLLIVEDSEDSTRAQIDRLATQLIQES